jgi:hypothetical protein
MISNAQPSLPYMAPPRLHASDRKPIKRCVRRVRMEPDPDGTYVFRARSFSRERGRVYRCTVNPRDGHVWCGCRDFEFRKGPLHPSLYSGPLCKHLERAARTVRQAERARENAATVL